MASTIRLVGRDAEIAELDREYRLASAGEFRVVLLVADPGLGKTRLAGDFMARKRDRTIGLSGRGHPLGATASFGIWGEALERYLRRLPTAEVRELCGGFTDDLGTLLHTVAALSGPASESTPSRLRFLGGLAAVLFNLTRVRPVIVLLDDAHEADPSSWEALGYFARNLSDARLLALVAVRPFELSENVVATEVLRRLEQDGFLRRLELHRLDTNALGDLARMVVGDEMPSHALLDWLEARSCGNPLFAVGLLEALRDAGGNCTIARLPSVPDTLSARVLGLLDNFDREALSVLECLSTFGRRAEFHDLVRLSALPSEGLAGILERLVRSRLVLEAERGRDLTYEIAHPLVQDVIYQHIGLARRRGVHRVVGRALLASGRLGEAALHFARSADVGDNEAIDALRDAVHQAETLEAYREALTILGVLVELIPPKDTRWLRVLEVLSWQAEWVVDHRADGHALLGIKAMTAIDRQLQDSADARLRAMVRFRLASFLGWGSGDLAEAEHACLAAQSLFARGGDGASASLARNELAWIHGLRGDYRGMEEAAEAVAAEASTVGDPLATIQGLQAQAFAAGFRGRFREAEDAVRRSNAIARAEDKIYRVTIGLTNLGIVFASQGRCAEALEALEEAKTVNPDWRDSILPEWEIAAHWFAGDFSTALARARDAAAHALGELSKRRAFGVVFAALAAIEAGKGAEAQRFINNAQRAFGGRDWQFFSHYCGYAQGVLDWQEGRLSQGCARLSEAATRVTGTGALPYASLVLADLVEVAAADADARLATETARQLRDVGTRIDCDLYRGLAVMASGWADLAAGVEVNASSTAEAIGHLSSTGCRAFQARAWELRGRSLVSANRPDAIDALNRAVAIFDACGAVWRRDRIRSVLRSLGPTGRRAAQVQLGPGSLSRRERQIARLAAEGLMASEMAARLSISERTVETHLANVYAKLGVRSKVELIRRAAEFMLNP